MKKIALLPYLLSLTSGSVWAAVPSFSVEQCRAVKAAPKRLQCYDAIPAAGAAPAADALRVARVWVSEPDSFLGIKLDQPAGDGFSTLCPAESSYGSPTFNEYQWGKNGKPRCFLDHPKTVPRWAEFKGHGVDDFRKERIYMYQGSLAGKVSVSFFSMQYADILASLVQKYGSPLATSKGVMRLNNGAELPNEISTWVGKKGVLSIQMLDQRDTYNGITDYGSVTWTSVDYLRETDQGAEKENQDRSSKF